MASHSGQPAPKPAPKPDDPGGLPLAFALAVLAGAVDAVSYVHWHGLYVSFMSGNSTSLAIHATHAESAKALLGAAVIGGFVAGAMVGELLTSTIGRRVAEAVLLLEAALLTVVAVGLYVGGNEFLLAPTLSLAMGLQNAAVHREGGVSVSLTYVTGTLVHLGRCVAKAIRVQAPWSAAFPYLLLWLGLMLGAVAGALVAGRSEVLALTLAAGTAVVLSILVALSLVGTPPVSDRVAR